ncbi:MoeA, N-terminal and linker domain-containing protein [Aspergillus pseudotamarii]|uniref:molybdopterin adenylyltransferase n=1 Tax=Aspergillus pseudotamarii TaxID=132259 RepID=A0A5N6ST43_ASPPS|nr:MoeA, N-terminal and linker domain-containing protein [Aspergillus pseudotamarii]KAE8137848.1 MoeA, N-terminal and linker domain-containing protein [Aspergillus pseudotamarii]
MGLSYTEAIRLVEAEAHRKRYVFLSRAETCSIFTARGRIARHMIYSPISTPRFDTSAMDGYALNSAATQDATVDYPKTFEVQGITAAGDEPLSQVGRDGIFPPCVEIMTGAPFPKTVQQEDFDCCVRYEDVRVEERSGRRFIAVTKPVKPNQNRRLAATDFRTSDAIVKEGELIHPNHVLAMASLGITELSVLPKPRIAVFSTGSELLPAKGDSSKLHRISDSNGPYLTAMLEDWGAIVDFLGVLPDHPEDIEQALLRSLQGPRYDLIISSGAVSAGRYDMIPTVLERVQARTVFHKVEMRPGHPVLYSMLPRPGTAPVDSEVAFFGLPGNPVASAACLRFIVALYLNTIQLQPPEKPYKAHIMAADYKFGIHHGIPLSSSKPVATVPMEKDVFRPGTFCGSTDQDLMVQLISDHSPGKIKPFLEANCWIRIPHGVSEVGEGDSVGIYPMR